MSDTPRTDNLHQRYHSRYTDGHYTCYVSDVFDFARQLERELAETNRIIKECLSVMPVGYIPSHTPENLPAKIEWLVKELAENTTIRHERVAEELAKVTKQRDLLIEGLEKLASCDWVITLPDRMDAVREIAKQTLQIVKNNKH